MRVSALALVLLLGLATLALAGCSGGDGGDGGDRGGAGSNDGRTGLSVRRGEDGGDPSMLAPLELPVWAVGDAWTYTFNGAETTYVVTSETATDWIMETDSEERSFSDLRQDVSRLGPQRKSDLAGSQDDERVEFFRWPLADGASWTTTWDHVPVTVSVLLRPGEGKADLTATGEDGDPLYQYVYDAEKRWFSELHRFDPEGREVVSLVLTKAVHAWAGTIVRWTATTVIESAGNNPAQPPTVGGPFEVPVGTTDIWAQYRFACGGNGGFLVSVVPANPGLAGQAYTANGQCLDVNATGVIVDGPHPGTWTFAISAGGQTIDYAFTLLLRTRQDVAFPV